MKRGTMMLSSSEKVAIINEYREIHQSIRKKSMIIFLRIGLFMILGLVAFIFIVGWKDNMGVQITTYIVGGLALLSIAISFIVGKYMYSGKPTYEFLIPKLIEKMNLYEESSLKYEAYNKERKTINKESQLFTRGATVTVYSEIKGYNEYLEQWSLLDIKVIISTGQSTAILFDGFLYEIDRANPVAYQLRTSSRPSNKPIKFRKEERLNDYKLFVEDEQNIPSNTSKVATELKNISDMFHVKHLYFAAMKEKTYIALQSRELPRKQRKIDETDVQHMYDRFVDYIKVVNMLGDGQYNFED
jgi:hypothetical protein